MDWKTFVVEIVRALAWPASAVVLAALLRNPVIGLFSAVRKISVQGWDVYFADAQRGLDSAAAQLAVHRESAAIDPPPSVAPAPTDAQAGMPPRAAATDSAQPDGLRTALVGQPLADMIEVAPAGSIILGWSVVEAALRSAAQRTGISTDLDVDPGGSVSSMTALRMVDILVRAKVVSLSTRDAIHALSKIRNSVVHSKPDALRTLSPNTAREFTGMANAVCAVVEAELREHLTRPSAHA